MRAVAPSSGTVQLAGREIGALSEDERARVRNDSVGFVFQNFQLIPTLTALENVLVPLELRGDAEARTLVPEMAPAEEADWTTEYLAPILSVRVVEDLDAAAAHIAQKAPYGHAEQGPTMKRSRWSRPARMSWTSFRSLVMRDSASLESGCAAMISSIGGSFLMRL